MAGFVFDFCALGFAFLEILTDVGFFFCTEYARAGTLEGISGGHIDNVAKLVAKVEKCERKIDNSQREMNNLQAKDGDADRKQQVSTLLYQYRQELANLEDDVREAIGTVPNMPLDDRF
jgi:DNA repair exonuclease SbcCD ATPase subunit